MYPTHYPCQVSMKLEFPRQVFEKNIQRSYFMKIRLVGAELFHVVQETDRRTDMKELIIAFRTFANALKISILGIIA
jgi:hypothetical protein